MAEKLLLKNAWAIVTCDANDTVHSQCDLLMEGNVIVAMGKDLPSDGCTVVDATGKIIYPGLVNTHHHLFQAFVRNQASIDCPNLSLMEWLDKIYRIFVNFDADDIYYASMTAMADLIKHGCTTVFDQQYCYTTHTGKDPIDRQVQAAKILGMRYHGGRGTNTLPRSAGSTIPDEMCETTEEFIADTARLIDTYHDKSDYSMCQIVVAPCQPVNSYEETFVEAVKLAREKGVRLHTHLGEGENGVMLERHGISSLEWCKKVGFIGPDVWFAHGWFLTMDECKELAAHGSGIAHCSSGAVLGGFPMLPVLQLEQMGVTVGLGVDGNATNDGSSLLDAIRVAYLMQAHHSRERGGSVSAYQVLKMATIQGAKLLGRAHDIGSLEIGKAGDMFLLDVSTLDMVGSRHDPRNLIGKVGATNEVYMTIINGKIVFENHVLKGIDEAEVAAIAEERCTQLLRKSQTLL